MTKEPQRRTGFFGEVLLLPESSGDGQLAERVAQAQPVVRRRVARRLAELLGDGRSYVVEWQPAQAPGEWSIEMLSDQVSAAAIVTLLRPEEARVGDLVHIESIHTTGAIQVGPDGLVPIGDWRFAWTPNGWERVQ